MQRPREPAPGECCGSGCTRCVWDIYYDDLARFEEFVAGGGEEKEPSASSEEDEPLSYVGSVVVKFLTPAERPDDCVASVNEVEKDVMEARELVPIESVSFVKSSENVFDPHAPSVNIITLHTPPFKVRPMPGDTVEVLVPNRIGTGASDDVARLCKALDVDPTTWCELRRSPFVPEDSFPPWLPLEVPLTVEQLLSFYVDISSSSYLLHRSFFEGLLRIYNNSKAGPKAAGATPDFAKVQLLEECASSDRGAELFRALSNSSSPLCYPSLVDVLETFSFVKVPLDRLLEVSGPLQPRKFSVANFTPPDAPADSLQLCMREVCALRTRNFAKSTVSGSARRLAELLNEAPARGLTAHSEFFFGHTSHPLCDAARLSGSGLRIPPRNMYVGFSLFGTSAFAKQLQSRCASVSSPFASAALRSPVFLVGCGTGIAPLIAAVSQLMYHRGASSGEEAPLPFWVFYGARTKAELVYHAKFEEAMAAGAISRYEYALSRETEEGQSGSRVTDLIKKHRGVISSALQDAGHMFVCGPANALRSVRQLLERDLLAEADDDDSVREQRILFLEQQGRLSFDIWSTGNIF